MADMRLTNISGADVPNATMVSPTTICDTLNLRAKLAAPSVKRSAPHITPTAPIRIKIIACNIIILLVIIIYVLSCCTQSALISIIIVPPICIAVITAQIVLTDAFVGILTCHLLEIFEIDFSLVAVEYDLRIK